MCGIAGILSLTINSDDLTSLSDALINIYHRGPDDFGTWSESPVALGHVRLSILDTSVAGSQPMASRSGRYIIVFNGEIYNHLSLRVEIDVESDYPWRGHSDTETILACIESWGLEETLRRSVGMFALAVWDNQLNILHLARDRIGEKPLYYFHTKDRFIFASELKALRSITDKQLSVDRNALAIFLKYGYIPAPNTIYEGVSKLTPGTIISLYFENGFVSDPKRKQYWSLHDVRSAAISNPFLGSPMEAVDMLETAIKTSVSGQMLSDVPLGAFLSGGIDSSTIVAIMQSHSNQPVKTFSIGFNEAGYSEHNHARIVAEHLETDHTELIISQEDALAVVPELSKIYDEPIADVSQIPTFLVSRLAKTKVTVCLSGDGGDEIFCGYNRYVWGERIWRGVAWLPLGIRRIMAFSLRKISAAQWDCFLNCVNCLLPQRLRIKTIGNRLHRLAGALSAPCASAFYEMLTAKWLYPESVVLGALAPEESKISEGFSVEEMMMGDILTYLPDDILVKVDRAAMACSLETRVPLLDHRIIEMAIRLPMHLKTYDGEGKWILKQVLYRYVPRSLVARPKMGFDVPLDVWLRGSLRSWAERLLSTDRLQREGYFDVKRVRRMWEEHLSGQSNWHAQLWCVLMFQVWLEENG